MRILQKTTLVSIIFTVTAVIFHPTTLQATVDDPAYHTYDEIVARIFAIQDSVPDWVRIDTIGFSQEDGLPIYVVKVNEDVHDEPSNNPAVFFHVLHAEEVLGTEYQMWLLEKLIKQEDRRARDWFRDIDTYICPTSNPEGHQVVFTLDPSWRKNKRCNMQDGRFRWQPNWGGDTSGVDINRNFPLFWIHGDGFLKPSRNERYDYYRGPGPLSESEAQALDRFVAKIRPLFVLTIHSSRTGDVAERIFYPWGRGWLKYSKPKFSPDIDQIRVLAESMAARTSKWGSPGQKYLAAPISSWQGECDSYFYWKYGCISQRMEIGGEKEAMQPDSAGIMRVIDDVHNGIEYLLNCAIETSNTDVDDVGAIDQRRVDIKTVDQAGQPLEAVLYIESRSNPMMPYRTTAAYNGIYRWIMPIGFTDTMTVRKYGYYSHRDKVTANTPRSAMRTVILTELPLHTLQLQAIAMDSSLIGDNIELEIRQIWAPQIESGWGSGAAGSRIDVPPDYPENLQKHTMQNGQIEIELPEGGYSLTLINGDKHVPRLVEITLDSNISKQVVLADAVTLLNENFDDAEIIFTSDNITNRNAQAGDSLARWDVADGIHHSAPRCLTDSRYGNTLINEDSWCAPYNMLDNHFNLETAGTAALVYWLNQALEPGYDSMWVEVSTGGAPGSDPNGWTWVQAAPAHMELSILENIPIRPWNAPPVYYQQYAPWNRFVIPLDGYCGQPVVHFRFHIMTDEFIEEDGVYIDDVMLLASNVTPPVLAFSAPIPMDFELGEPYPNPFNGKLTIPFNLPEEGIVRLALFDITGRRVLEVSNGLFPSGNNRMTINDDILPSGLYILHGDSPTGSDVKKVMLIK